MRVEMSEYIKREDAVNAFYTATSDGDKAEWSVGVILSIPTADVRPVVYCRDCKHWKFSELTPLLYVCTYVFGAKFVRNADDFCSRGERCDAEMRGEESDV